LSLTVHLHITVSCLLFGKGKVALCDAAHKKRFWALGTGHWAPATQQHAVAGMMNSYLANDISTGKFGKLIIVPASKRSVVVEALYYKPEGHGFVTG
jgi:hypothetical protein